VTPLRIAHRGYAALGEPNSLAAVRRALALGCDVVELDVRRRGDGVLVLDHDDGDRAGAPLLDEALAQVAASGAAVNLDVKEADATAAAGEALARAGLAGRAVCSGYGWDALLALQAARPGIRAALTVPTRSSRLPRAVKRMLAVAGRPLLRRQLDAALARDGVSLVTVYHPLVDAAAVAAVRRAGAELWTWTVDDPHELARLAQLGVDGICSDRPASHGLGGDS
jgi:glycerophosphoryl diester phosphodiesterase